MIPVIFVSLGTSMINAGPVKKKDQTLSNHLPKRPN
jgi:hypothetical protein